jgi:putative acyl-CoA dehydrogenase
MTAASPRSDLGTHEVFNQPGPLCADLFATDPTLRAHMGEDRELAALGAALGSDEMRMNARDAQTRLPELRLFDSAGQRIDEVHFHPGYHALMGLGLGHGYAASAWGEGGATAPMRPASICSARSNRACAAR